MSTHRDRRRLHGQLNRIPTPIRVAAFLVWFGAAGFAKWQGVNDHDTPPAVWAILLAGLVVVSGLRLFEFRDAVEADDREPFDVFSIGWLGFFVFTGSLLVLGPFAVFDGDPSTNPYVGGLMFLVGVILVALLAHHLAKPVRPVDAPPSSLGAGSARTDAGTKPWYTSEG